jgi:hypothetical protein
MTRLKSKFTMGNYFTKSPIVVPPDNVKPQCGVEARFSYKNDIITSMWMIFIEENVTFGSFINVSDLELNLKFMTTDLKSMIVFLAQAVILDRKVRLDNPDGVIAVRQGLWKVRDIATENIKTFFNRENENIPNDDPDNEPHLDFLIETIFEKKSREFFAERLRAIENALDAAPSKIGLGGDVFEREIRKIVEICEQIRQFLSMANDLVIPFRESVDVTGVKNRKQKYLATLGVKAENALIFNRDECENEFDTELKRSDTTPRIQRLQSMFCCGFTRDGYRQFDNNYHVTNNTTNNLNCYWPR